MALTKESVMAPMPGSFLFQCDYSNGALNNVFQPPNPSPLPANRKSYLSRSASRSSNQQHGRKRPRLDTNTSYFSRPVHDRSTTTTSTPFAGDGSYDYIDHSQVLESSTPSLEDYNPLSPVPLANSDYNLAGGQDTPCASLERGFDELAQSEAERDYRFNRYTTTNTSRTTISTSYGGGSTRYSSLPQTPDAGSIVIGGMERKCGRQSTPPATRNPRTLTGWGIRNTAWALTGGLAGKVFNFCINTAFRGFSAGGGNTYRFEVGTPGANSMDIDEKSDVFSCRYYGDSEVPGGFPQQDVAYAEGYGHERSALRKGWQIVDQIDRVDDFDEQSPVRKRSRASVAGVLQRPRSRNSITSSTLRKGSTTGASYASPRARPSPSARSSYDSRNSNSGTLNTARRVRPSLISPRKSQSHYFSSDHNGNNSSQNTGLANSDYHPPSQHYTYDESNNPHCNEPVHTISPDVADYKRKMKQREKVQDENLKRLNAQLRDMIREGKEALGSTIEILDDDDDGDEVVDEGFYENRWD